MNASCNCQWKNYSCKNPGSEGGKTKIWCCVHLVVHDPCTYQFTQTSPSTSQVSGLKDCVTCDVAHPILAKTTHFNLASLHVYFRVGTTTVVPTWNLVDRVQQSSQIACFLKWPSVLKLNVCLAPLRLWVPISSLLTHDRLSLAHMPVLSSWWSYADFSPQ